jgi:uncharacterized protein YccT (UPF0319 family)
MKKQDNIKVRLKDLASFQRWQKLKAASKALSLKLDNLAQAAGLPSSKQFKRNCKGYLVNGNGDPVAKFSVYDMPARSMPACKVCRIS